MALDLNTIATDGDLAGGRAFGSTQKRDAAMPKAADRDSMRAAALSDVLEALKARTPPIFESDLATPGELKDAVVYRACELIARSARAVAGDTWDAMQRDFRREYDSAVRRNFTVQGVLTGPSCFSFEVERR